jgi:hypothetical protein
MSNKNLFTPFQTRVVNAIISLVCSYFNQPESIIHNKRRTKNIVVPKQYCIYFIREILTDMKLVDLANFFQYNHASILHSVKVVKTNAMVDSESKKQTLDLHKLISEKYLTLVLENNGHNPADPLSEKEKWVMSNKFKIIGEAMWYDLKLGDVVTKDDFMSYFKFMMENN